MPINIISKTFPRFLHFVIVAATIEAIGHFSFCSGQNTAYSNPAPFAVPTLPSEEAEKANEFAQFLRTIKLTIVEGEILERSELPDPQQSDYPNCRFTAHFKGNSILSGEPCPREISLIIEGFANYRILETNKLRPGKKVKLSIIPFDSLPEDEKSTQQADDLELFLLESYYVVSAEEINSYSDNSELMSLSGIFFLDNNDEYISIFERHINPPIPDDVKKTQIASIQKDLEKANELLNGFDEEKINETNRLFDVAWDSEKAKDAPGFNRTGGKVWRNIDNSFWVLPRGYKLLQEPSKISQDMLNSFSSLKKVCEANGVQLIVSLVPHFHVISSRVINPDFHDVPDLQTATYVKQLSEIGIETIYASDSIIKNYNRFPFAFCYPGDAHPADTTQDCLTDILVERLQRYNIPQHLDPELFKSEMDSSHFYNATFKFPSNCDIGNNKEGSTYQSRHIYYNNDFIKRNPKSPIMILGNSFIQSPMYSPDAFPTLLSYKILSSVDWERVSGYGPFSDILIRMLSSPDFYLKGKKVLIIQVGTEHIKTVSETETMLDIAKLDRERLVLNNKKMICHFVLPSSTDVTQEECLDESRWGPLSNVDKTVIKLDSSGTNEYKITLTNDVKDSKPIACLIQHTGVALHSMKGQTDTATSRLTVNGISNLVRASFLSSNARFFNLVFELPAGTKEITVKAEGKPSSLFAIKDIQIWQ